MCFVGMKHMGKIIFLLAVGGLSVRCVCAADTLRVSLRQADSIFQVRSYYLLAAALNVEAQRAQVLQASLYPNPVFTADLNAFNPERRRWADIGSQGQKAFQIEQLILLGSKKKAEIQLARTNALIAETELQRLSRELKFRLHTQLFASGQQRILLAKYNSQMALLDTLLNTYGEQAAKGNIPLKEVVRLKSAYLKLGNDRAALYQDFYETQAQLQTLLQTDKIIRFEFAESEITGYIKDVTLNQLQQEALNSRPDWLMMQQQKTFAEQYLAYQQKLAVPNVNLFANYDQRGGAFNDQLNVGLNIELPLFNRNQGNIRSARYKLQETEQLIKAFENEMMSRLQASYGSYRQTISEYNRASRLYNADFEIILQGITDNFRKRNVSIIEFIDFFESYNDALTELMRTKIQLVTSAEQLNLLTGKDIY